MEMAIALDTLFEQIMIIGDARPYLTAVIVLNPEQWENMQAGNLKLDVQDPQALRIRRIRKAR